MTLLVRRTDTGEEVEVLDITGDGMAFVAPPGNPGQGVLVPRKILDPDPMFIALTEGFQPWTEGSMSDRGTNPRSAEA